MFFRFNGLIWAAPLLALIPLLFSSLAADAADSKGRFALHGAGAQTCAQFTDEVKKNDPVTNDLLLSWIAGYMTALNRSTKDTYDVTPIVQGEALIGFILLICDKSPDVRVETAIDGLFKSLVPARVVSESPLLTLEQDGKKLELRRQIFVAVADALIQKKYYKGAPEDKLTLGLAAALKAYQKDEKLPETGLPDAETVVRLLLANAEHPGPRKNR
jgi:Putative peptidoglycan binding domain